MAQPEMDELLKAVERQNSVVASAIVAFRGMADQLASAIQKTQDMDDVDEMRETFRTSARLVAENTDRLASAIAANTPQAQAQVIGVVDSAEVEAEHRRITEMTAETNAKTDELLAAQGEQPGTVVGPTDGQQAAGSDNSSVGEPPKSDAPPGSTMSADDANPTVVEPIPNARPDAPGEVKVGGMPNMAPEQPQYVPPSDEPVAADNTADEQGETEEERKDREAAAAASTVPDSEVPSRSSAPLPSTENGGSVNTPKDSF